MTKRKKDLKVVVFEPDYNKRHREVLRAFAEGVPGAIVRPVSEYEECDIAVIFGGVKRAFKPTYTKRKILSRHKGRNLIMIESAFIKRGKYYQIGFGGSAGHADFNCKKYMPTDRFMAIGANLIPYVPKYDGPIVVCGQLPRDVQVQDVDHIGWVRETVAYYRKRKMNVLFRPHPKVDDPLSYGVSKKLIDTRPLDVVLNEARCFVTWNSTSAVDAAVAGVPVVTMDRGSIAWEIGSHNLDDVDYRPEIGPWLARLGYAQWTLDEMREGLPWRHLMGE